MGKDILGFPVPNEPYGFCGRLLTILGFDGRGGKSSTVTNRNVTASQIWVENKPKTLLWLSEAKNQ